MSLINGPRCTHIVKDLSRVVEADILPMIDAVPPLLPPIPEVDGDGGHLDGLVLLLDAALAHLPPSVLGLVQRDVVNLGQIIQIHAL